MEQLRIIFYIGWPSVNSMLQTVNASGITLGLKQFIACPLCSLTLVLETSLCYNHCTGPNLANFKTLKQVIWTKLKIPSDITPTFITIEYEDLLDSQPQSPTQITTEPEETFDYSPPPRSPTDEMNGENICLSSSTTLEVDDKKNRRSRPPSQ